MVHVPTAGQTRSIRSALPLSAGDFYGPSVPSPRVLRARVPAGRLAPSTGPLPQALAVFPALCVNAPGGVRFRDRAVGIFAARASSAPLLNRSPSTLPQRSRLELPEHLEPTDAWRDVRAELRRAVGESTWEIWLDPLEVKSLQGNVLSVTAPPSTLSWVAQRFGRLLDTCAQAVLGPEARVSLDHQGDAPSRRRGGV